MNLLEEVYNQWTFLKDKEKKEFQRLQMKYYEERLKETLNKEPKDEEEKYIAEKIRNFGSAISNLFGALDNEKDVERKN